MGADQYVRQQEQIRAKRIAAEKKMGEYRVLESRKREEADKAGVAAEKTSSASRRKSKQAEQARRLAEAQSAARKAADWQKKIMFFSRQEADVARKLERARSVELKKNRDREKREHDRRIERLGQEQSLISLRLDGTERNVESIMRIFPEPEREKLRVLVLSANPFGDLRVEREQKKIKEAVQWAAHRDWIEIEIKPAATLKGLFDGLASFSPHIVHFSGHSNVSQIFWNKMKITLMKEF